MHRTRRSGRGDDRAKITDDWRPTKNDDQWRSRDQSTSWTPEQTKRAAHDVDDFIEIDDLDVIGRKSIESILKVFIG
jgi:hypothetical protein